MSKYLDITVYTSMPVHVVQPFQNFFQNGSYHRLLQALRRSERMHVKCANDANTLQQLHMSHLRICKLHKVQNRATSYIRHDHPQILLMNKWAMEWQHIWVVLLPHCLCFSDNLFLHKQGAIPGFGVPWLASYIEVLSFPTRLQFKFSRSSNFTATSSPVALHLAFQT